MQALPGAQLSINSEKRVPRVGLINFINCLPVVLPIMQNTIRAEAEFLYGTPSQLNELLGNRILQVSSVSSYFYLTQTDLELIPKLSISSVGSVGSVLFFCKCNPQDLHGMRIAVPSSSATSVNLLKILLQEEYGVTPKIVVVDKPRIELPDYVGVLVIGDYALEVDVGWSAHYNRWDLGEWWHKRYGIPMVFGVWAADKQWFKTEKVMFEEICKLFYNALEIGMTSLFTEVVKTAQMKIGLNQDRIVAYFRDQLDFHFSEEHEKGLRLYKTLCRSYSFI